MAVCNNVVTNQLDAEARNSLLQKLDAIVTSQHMDFVKAQTMEKTEASRDEARGLEEEVRSMLQAGYCELYEHLPQKVDECNAAETTLVTRWHCQISYPRLQFEEEAAMVRRPPFVSAYPAALAPVDGSSPTSLRFRVIALPPNGTIISAGVAKWPGFPVYFGKGFGEEADSWGLQWRAEDGIPVDPLTCGVRLSRSDTICISCDRRKCVASISLNGHEAAVYSLPDNDLHTFVLGATLSTACVLKIVLE